MPCQLIGEDTPTTPANVLPPQNFYSYYSAVGVAEDKEGRLE